MFLSFMSLCKIAINPTKRGFHIIHRGRIMRHKVELSVKKVELSVKPTKLGKVYLHEEEEPVSMCMISGSRTGNMACEISCKRHTSQRKRSVSPTSGTYSSIFFLFIL